MRPVEAVSQLKEMYSDVPHMLAENISGLRWVKASQTFSDAIPTSSNLRVSPCSQSAFREVLVLASPGRSVAFSWELASWGLDGPHPSEHMYPESSLMTFAQGGGGMWTVPNLLFCGSMMLSYDFQMFFFLIVAWSEVRVWVRIPWNIQWTWGNNLKRAEK